MPKIDVYRLDAYSLDGPSMEEVSRLYFDLSYNEPMPPSTTLYKDLFTIPASENFADMYSGTDVPTTDSEFVIRGSTNGGGGAGLSRVSLTFEDDQGKRYENMLPSSGEYNNGNGYQGMILDRVARKVTFLRIYRHIGTSPTTNVYTLPSDFNIFGDIKVKIRHISNPASTNRAEGFVKGYLIIT
ncbi:hypothetical protein [Paenibacillus sp. ISL-20]|uniref:hypothetical protein n=1 Tax=Paenibacillus sp. ISL-20 TaxID=2819163 RepID=UPI001BEA337F|nr:hypothetical protein [Paenibacillus sp. ISL-20]MBT2761794.1 hypothetical protein [Paenibacillus sp. ISL-20]